jgi:hypothetical protein
MKRLAVLFYLAAGLGFAATWSGTLVDAKCFDAEERNVNPTDTLTAVDRDTNSELRYCSPGAKTKAFAVVQTDGTKFDLDAAGNAKATELVRASAKKSVIAVVVTGERTKNTIQVGSIAVVK